MAQFPPRAAEAAWPQWQGQQQQPQSNAQQHPHAQGNQQDMFPVSHVHHGAPLSLISLCSHNNGFPFLTEAGCAVYAGPAQHLQRR